MECAGYIYLHRLDYSRDMVGSLGLFLSAKREISYGWTCGFTIGDSEEVMLLV